MQKLTSTLTLNTVLLAAGISVLGLFSVDAHAVRAKRVAPPVVKASGGLATINADDQARSLDVTNLGAAAKAQQDKPAADKTAKKRTKFAKSDEAPTGLLNVSAAEISETLRGINLLIAKNPAEQDLPKLLLNRAMATYSLARRRLIDSKDMRVDATGTRLLKVAAADATRVAAMKGVNVSQLAKSEYIKGLTYIYLEDTDAARASFQKSMSINPASDDVGWMALYIAEDYFDKGQFREAVPFYSNYAPRMGKKANELARYKLAWCYINLNTQEKSQRIFIDLIKEDPKEGFGRDSIKDLAFLMTTYNTEEDIIRTGAKLLVDENLQIEFLSTALANLENQHAVNYQSKVLRRLLVLEKDPIKKMAYLLTGMRTSRKDYASLAHYNSFVETAKLMKGAKLGTKEGSDSYKGSLDLEVQALMKSFVETFSGRVKTPENIPKAKLAIGLKNLFEFYEHYFNDTKIYPETLKLWIDVCYEVSDWKCVDVTADKILERKDLEKVHNKVSIDQLAALEQMNKDTNKGVDSRVKDKFEAFVKNQTKAKQWTAVATRLGEYYLFEKKYDQAIPLYATIFDREQDGDSLYRLTHARFEAGKFQEILDEKREAKKNPDARVRDLKRESALNIAMKARSDNNFEVYKKNIFLFLLLGPSPEKAEIAKKDYYNFLLEKGLISELVVELSKRHADSRCVGELSHLCEQAWLQSMKQGRFDEAILIYSLDRKKWSQKERSWQILALLANKTRPDADSVLTLRSENRDYLMGLLVLLQPDFVINSFSKNLPVRGKENQNLAALALRIKSGSWELMETSRNKKILGDRFKFAVVVNESQQLPSEKFMAKISIPTRQLKGQALQRWSQDIVFQVGQMRKKLPADLAKKPPLTAQIRALETAENIELKVADFIKNQPIPDGLAGPQLEQYQKGIEELAASYTNQAKEWATIREKVKSAKVEQDVQVASLDFPQVDLTRYNWSDSYRGDSAKALRRMVDEHNFLGAMIILDLLRPEMPKDDSDYFRIRTGILMASQKNAALRRYILSELTQKNQTALLNELQGDPHKVVEEKMKNSAQEIPDKEGDLENEM